MKQIKVNNIFHSIQGEGFNTGLATIFIRLSGCNERCEFCDTDFKTGIFLYVEQILERLQEYHCKNLTWTGGEPTMQLSTEIVEWFNDLGYTQFIETNGSFPMPNGLFYISCSPKLVSMERLKQNISGYCVGEFRCVIGLNEKGIPILPPEIEKMPYASNYYVSPLFTGYIHEKYELDPINVQMAVDWLKADPRWKLSIQVHKLLKIQ